MSNKPNNSTVAVIVRGIVLAVLYFMVTRAKDMTPRNIILFATLYSIMFLGADLIGLNHKIVTTAFVTKTIFTLVDERVKKHMTRDNEKEYDTFDIDRPLFPA
jgi:hypothetical protein